MMNINWTIEKGLLKDLKPYDKNPEIFANTQEEHFYTILKKEGSYVFRSVPIKVVTTQENAGHIILVTYICVCGGIFK